MLFILLLVLPPLLAPVPVPVPVVLVLFSTSTCSTIVLYIAGTTKLAAWPLAFPHSHLAQVMQRRGRQRDARYILLRRWGPVPWFGGECRSLVWCGVQVASFGLNVGSQLNTVRG